MKPDILLEAKLQHPHPVRDYVERTALMKKIKTCRERLIVFHANMGFGKTMFMSEYALRSGCRFLWYHLDRQDNDCAVFLGYLRESIRQNFGEEGKKAAEGIRDGQTAAAALNLLSGGEAGDGFRLLIMLDDFQEIVNEELYELLDVILKNTLSRIRLLITTKGTLPRFVNRYVLEGAAAVWKTEDLAFSREETFRLLSSVRGEGIDPDVAEAIYRYTEGWPAGVMFLHLYQKQGYIPVGRDQMLKICQEYLVHDYIMYELFRKLPFDLQEFLKKTSVLEYLDSRICNAVAQVKNASGQLRYLVQENMFVQKIEGDFEVYRYHSMFRDFLKSQLTEEDEQELYGRAAVCCLGSGQPQQALEYALAANSRSMVETVLERRGFWLLAQQRYFLLAEALDWCRVHGGGVSEYGRVLELFLKLYTGGELAGMEKELLEQIRSGGDRKIQENLVAMSAEFYCEKGMDDVTDRILEAALEQKELAVIKRFEYLTARIFLQIRQGRMHQAKLLYKSILAEPSEGSISDRERRKIRQMRKLSLELTEPWKPWTEADEEDSGEKEEAWWMSDQERLLLGQLDRWRCRLYGKEEGASGWEDRDDSCKSKEEGPEWMEAFWNVRRGLELFEAGDRTAGCKLVLRGTGILKKYPWLSWPSGWLDRRRYLCLCMLDEAKTEEAASFHIFVNCFGRFRMTVIETGEDIRFRTHKAKECMAYLCMMKRPVSREQLIEALWNDVDQLPSNEVAALHNIFSTLRKSLSPYGLENLICYEDKKYFLRDGLLFSDIGKVEELLRAADAGDQERMLQLSGICQVYEGSFFADIGGVWCVSDRAYYDRKLGSAFFQLAQIYKKEQDYETCLRILDMAEETNMLREPITLCKMDCYIELRDGNMLKAYYRWLEKNSLEIIGEPPGEAVRKRYRDGMKICGKQ